jgi:hypothetical protein
MRAAREKAASRFSATVSPDNEMISHFTKAPLPMPLIDFRSADIHR